MRAASNPRRRFFARYRPRAAAFTAPLGSLERFLTERYCLYTVGAKNTVFRAEIHHPPWLLQRAEGALQETTVAPLDLAGEPLLHFAARQDVLTWLLTRVTR